MTINENKWVSVGSVQDFVNGKSSKVVDPYFNWFISSLTANIDNYKFDLFTKANIVSFIYLLLNPQFQSQIKKIRSHLDIPINGFENEEIFNKWTNTLRQAVIDYQSKKKIPLKQNKLITFIEKQAIKTTAGRMPLSMVFNNLEDVFILLFIKLLKIGKDRNGHLWGNFFYHLIITFNPKHLFASLLRLSREDNIYFISDDSFGSISLAIPLTLDTTINSIKKTVERNKSRILLTIKEMKRNSPSTDIESLKIKRDYFIYTFYTFHKSLRKRMEDTSDNIRKEMAVVDKAEELLSEEEYEEIDKLKWKSMRKIVSRMKQRIRQSFIDKSDGLGNLLTAIETTELTPYPEYVAGRLTTRRHPPKK